MRFTASGTAVTQFSVAVNHHKTNANGEKQQETEWFSVVTWDKLAENCNQYIGKGDRVFVEGRMRMRSWENDSGVKQYKTELIAHQVIFLNERPNSKPPNNDPTDEPLPF